MPSPGNTGTMLTMLEREGANVTKTNFEMMLRMGGKQVNDKGMDVATWLAVNECGDNKNTGGSSCEDGAKNAWNMFNTNQDEVVDVSEYGKVPGKGATKTKL